MPLLLFLATSLWGYYSSIGAEAKAWGYLSKGWSSLIWQGTEEGQSPIRSQSLSSSSPSNRLAYIILISVEWIEEALVWSPWSDQASRLHTRRDRASHSFIHSATLSLSHSVTQSFRHSVIQSLSLSATQFHLEGNFSLMQTPPGQLCPMQSHLISVMVG